MENIFYFAVIVLSAVAVVWAISFAIQSSPAVQERRNNRALTEMAKRQNSWNKS